MSSKFDFCPTLADLYKERRVIGRSGRVFEEVGSLSTLNNIAHIRALMLESAPERTLEIGMAFGGSALTFAASHRDLGRAPLQQHTAIDPAQSSYWDGAGRQNLERAGLAEYVEVIEKYSAFALPQLITE